MAEMNDTDRIGSRRAEMEARQRESSAAARRSTQQVQRKRWAIFGLLGLALLLFVGYVVRETTAPLPGEVTEDEGRGHVQAPERVTYRNYPPSSGAHFGTVPPVSAYKLWDEPVPPESYVHALEHGGIVVVYNCQPDTCEALRDDLSGLYKQVSASKFGHVKFLMTPDPSIDPGLVVLAWGRRMDLEAFDADQIKHFYGSFVDRGPEDAP